MDNSPKRASISDRTRGVNFDQTAGFLREQVGRTIDVSMCLPAPGEQEPIILASVSGEVDRVVMGGGQIVAPGDLWRVWFDSTHGDQVTLRRELFESAEIVADQPPPDERAEGVGTTWTLTIRQAGLILDVLIYV